MMTTEQINSKVNELFEMETLLEETKQLVESLRDELKQELIEKNTETIDTGSYLIRWVSVLSNRLDSKALKEFAPDLYMRFTKQVPSRRFSISR